MSKSKSQFHNQVGAELYMQLGRAITQWAHVEDALLSIFLKFQATGSSGFVAAAIFHTPISDQVRIDMVNNMAKFILKKSPLLEEWKRLHDRYKGRLRKRNKIAHITALHDSNDPSKSVLRPGLFDVVRTNMGVTKDTLNAKQLVELQRSFSRLALDLTDFAEKLPPVEELLPAPKK